MTFALILNVPHKYKYVLFQYKYPINYVHNNFKLFPKHFNKDANIL